MIDRVSRDSITALSVLLLFMIFLCWAAYNQSFCFDASYNLISYQNLFLGKGFIYDYNGAFVPFDPVISTGPEFYIPALLLWFILGGVSYHAVIYVLVSYYLIFLSFFIFYVLRGTGAKTLSLLIFLTAFFCRQQLFVADAAFIAPIGEPLSVFFIFSGLYLLLTKKSRLLSFLLIGFGLDVKTNVVVAVLPVLAIIYLAHYFYPALKERSFRKFWKGAVIFFVGAVLVIGPMAFYTKIMPKLVLSGDNLAIWKSAVYERKAFMLERGFGHIVDSVRQDNIKSMVSAFIAFFKFKVVTAKTFFHNSFTIMALYAVLLFTLLWFSFRHRHFSFYIFLFVSFIYAWWLFGAGDPWYRYWSVGDFMFICGLASLGPVLYEKRRLPSVISLSVLLLFVFLPQFSFREILRHTTPVSKNEALKMAERISGIDEKQIFTYDWYQAPYIMILTEKRFQNFLDKDKLLASMERYPELYFLLTVENSMISDEMKMLEPILTPVAEFGANRFFKISYDKSLIESVFSKIEGYRGHQ